MQGITQYRQFLEGRRPRVSDHRWRLRRDPCGQVAGASAVDVTIVDRRKLLHLPAAVYQVLSPCFPANIARLSAPSFAGEKPNIEVLMDEPQLRPGAAQVHFKTGGDGYDYLMVATGATLPTLGRTNGPDSPGLKTMKNAIRTCRTAASELTTGRCLRSGLYTAKLSVGRVLVVAIRSELAGARTSQALYAARFPPHRSIPFNACC